jgi:hypothetical protein
MENIETKPKTIKVKLTDAVSKVVTDSNLELTWKIQHLIHKYVKKLSKRLEKQIIKAEKKTKNGNS